LIDAGPAGYYVVMSSITSRRRAALELKDERNRQAQARYRERHAERLALVRKITSILKRQSWHQGDAVLLAAALRRLLGDESVRALGRELRDRR
jgi:hypothetical protein